MCLFFHMNFASTSIALFLKASRNFYWNCINSISGFKKNWHLYDVDSCSAKTEDSFPLAGLCLRLCLGGHFKMFTSRLRVFVTLFTSEYLIFFIVTKMGFSSNFVGQRWLLFI